MLSPLHRARGSLSDDANKQAREPRVPLATSEPVSMARMFVKHPMKSKIRLLTQVAGVVQYTFRGRDITRERGCLVLTYRLLVPKSSQEVSLRLAYPVLGNVRAIWDQ